MEPLRFAFSTYALVGVMLLILAIVMLFFILRQSAKTRDARLVAAFFAGAGLSGLSIVLTNGLVFWGRLFAPWQDFWLLAGGVALVRYAYAVPRDDQPREAFSMLLISSALTLGALAVCVWFSYRFLFHWSPALDVPEAYYLLLPLGTLLVVAVCLHRSTHLSRLADASTGVAARRGLWRCLTRPSGNDALLMRNLALGLSLAFLPGIGFFVDPPNETLAILKSTAQHLGALACLAATALTYLNYAPVIASFVVKLVGVALLTVMLLMASVGNYHLLSDQNSYFRNTTYLVAATHAAINAQQAVSPPSPVSYVVSWNSADPADAAAYRVLFANPEAPALDLEQLVAENRSGHVAGRLGFRPDLDRLTKDTWDSAPRWHTYPEGSRDPDYEALRFTRGGTTYEIGLLEWHRLDHLSRLTLAWILVLAVACVLVLLLFPAFFRAQLVQPLSGLLAGVRRVNAGELETRVPVRYPDEIGQLTDAFNELTGTLKASYEELEQRVAARTRELAAFFDLSKLSTTGEPLSQQLHPALMQILEAADCDALCLHLLADDERTLTLAIQIGLPEAALAALETVAVPATLFGRIDGRSRTVTSNNLAREAAIPAPLRVAPFQSYLGTPLSPGGRVLGWLGGYRRAELGFGVSESALLVALARQIGVIVENHRLQQHTGRLAALEERQRLARDLHDSVTQLMYGLTLYSRAGREAAHDGDAPRLERNLDKVADTAEAALREMRALLFELQPPSLEEGGLAKAIEERLAIVERRVGLQVDSRIDETLAVPRRVAHELYHVALEALNNSLRHAAAEELFVSLGRVDGDVELVVADNGRGFDPATVRVGLGLPGMRARLAQSGGSLSLETGSGRGVRITARIPLPDNEAPETDE